MKLSYRFGTTALALCLAAPVAAQDLFAQGVYNDYQPNIENGKVIFSAAGCGTCHAVDGADDILAGGREIRTKFGELYAPNITAHPGEGLGNWSNADFLNAVLRGKSPDGRTYFGAVFPYPSYARMKPEDVLDLRGYIATLPQSDAPSKEHNISYLSQTILDLWSTGREPLPAKNDEQLQRGQYLVEAVGHCAECHTPRDTGFGFTYKLDNERAFQGETGLLGDYAPSIAGNRLEQFGAEAFIIGAMAESKKLNGNPMVSASMRRIARSTSALSVDDRAAMYAYLTGKNVDPTPFRDVVAAKTQDKQVEQIVGRRDVQPGEQNPGETAIAVASAIDDLTGAPALMSKVDAHCEAKNAPLQVEVAPAVVQNAAASGPKPVDPALKKEADQFIETYCRACHGPGKTYSGVFNTGSIDDMPFDKNIMKPGDPDGSPLYESILNNRMPTGKKPSAEELDVLRRWIVAEGEARKQPAAAAVQPAVVQQTGIPQKPAIDVPLPRFAGGSREAIVLAMVSDINRVDEFDRSYMRYLSFGRTTLAKIDCNEDGALRNPTHYLHSALNKFINSISNGPRVVPVTPIPATEGALVRIDIRDYNWTEDDWDSISTGIFTQGSADASFSREAWEELAEVYPYAVDPTSDPLLAVVAQATGAVVPMMRADWFVRFASESPYYDMFLGLTDDIRDLEYRMGIDVDREILSRRAVRAAMLPGNSGVSDHNRMLERFDLPFGGYYWKSYDFAGDSGEQSLTLHPDGPREIGRTASGTAPFEHDGGEMIFSLPNGLQGYYLSTNLGERLLVGPASIVSFRTKPIGKGVEVVNARSCFDCHHDGMIRKKDQLRDTLLSSSLFSRDELEVLLTMYVDNDTLFDYYEKDSSFFLSRLQMLNATEPGVNGKLTSLRAPESVGGGEIVTYLADKHFESLDVEELAREFYLDEDTFRSRARRMGDPVLTVVVLDWLSRLDAGGKIHRSEVETYYAALLPRLTDLEPYIPAQSTYKVQRGVAFNDYEAKVEVAIKASVKKQEEPYKPATVKHIEKDPAYKPPVDRLKLSLSVPYTEVYVNDLLEFDVHANKRCELQVFYVEESKEIVEMPQEILGPRFLEAGETRRIPYAGSGLQIRFDEPGEGETMLAFCREGGLADKGMKANDVLDYAKSRGQPLTRGITIEAAKKVQVDEGQSATNSVTFTVFK